MKTTLYLEVMYSTYQLQQSQKLCAHTIYFWHHGFPDNLTDVWNCFSQSYLLHIHSLLKTFYVSLKSYPRATFHLLVAKVYIVTGAHYGT